MCDLLAGGGELVEADRALAVDLCRRAAFVLVNLLSVQAQVYPTLFLEPETVEGEANDTDASSVLDPETHDDIMAQDYE